MPFGGIVALSLLAGPAVSAVSRSGYHVAAWNPPAAQSALGDVIMSLPIGASHSEPERAPGPFVLATIS